MKGTVESLNVSKIKGTAKDPVSAAKFVVDFGLEGDAHGAPGIKQISLLASEAVQKQKACPKVEKSGVELAPGVFGENITTKGLPLTEIKVGTSIKVGDKVIIEISKIGKECHKYCAIYYKTGDCIMPKEGVFAKVIVGGVVHVGDVMEVLSA